MNSLDPYSILMKNRFTLSFKDLLADQTKEFFLYYFLGILALIMTHKIQSDLPFLAKNLADKISIDPSSVKISSFFYLAIGIMFFRTSSRILFFYPARLLQKSLRSEMVLKLENTSPFRFRHINSGQLFQYLNGDIDQIRALIGFVGLQGGNFIIAFCILLPRLFAFHHKLLYALTPMFLSFFLFSFFVSKSTKYFKNIQETNGEVQNLIIETYTGKKTIKNFHAEKSFFTIFEDLSALELYYFYRASLGISIFLPFVTLGVGLSLLWGAYLIKELHLGASSLILFSGFIFLFMEPVSYLAWIGIVVSRSKASWTRLVDFNSTLDKQTDLEAKLIENNINNKFPLNFSIPYWDKNIDVEFIPHSWNVIVANTGAGKSELLLKISEILKQKKLSFSSVLQDPYIYNDTIVRNIFLNKKETTDDLIMAKKLLKILGLDYVEPDLDKLLFLEIGENGKRLSGGQAKRLCLIRSLMSEAEILIWDDPFSSVDLILEKEIMDELKSSSILLSKTLIISSHRLSTVKNSDWVYYFEKENGLIEHGAVGNLLQSTSKVYEHFKKQMV
jgi:ATP-binding cassette subfamily B protein